MEFQIKKNKDGDLSNPHSFCWRDHLINRYESLWSIIHKFALWNAVQAVDIRRIFSSDTGKSIHSDIWKWGNRDDLRNLGALDPIKLSTSLNLNNYFISESIVSNYIKQDELKTLGCDILRFCESCLQSGYHSALYQLLFLDKCPIHKKRFKTRCPNCGDIVSYRLNKISISKPYGCSKCGVMFCTTLSNSSRKVENIIIIDEREAKIKPLVAWLLQRRNFDTLEYVLKSDFENKFCEVKQNEIITYFTLFWSNVISFSTELKEIRNRQKPLPNNFAHLKIEFIETKNDEVEIDPFGRKWDKGLYSIYKSISRYFKRTLLFNHLKCIDFVGRYTWWGDYVLSCTGKICLYANAFLLWRMYFEGLDHPINLFKKYKGIPLNRSHINWDPPSYYSSESVLRRLFAFECYWIFFEALLIARTLNSNNTYSFNTFSIKKNYIPYWIIAPKIEGEVKSHFEFHYWLNRKELRQLNNPLCKSN